MRQVLRFIILALFLVNMCGCVALLAGTAGGVGTATWLSGKLIQEVNVPLDKSVKAAESALKSLGLEINKETKTETVAQITSKYNDGRLVWIDIHRVSRSSSRIEVRVGVPGDKDAAANILNKIERFL